MQNHNLRLAGDPTFQTVVLLAVLWAEAVLVTHLSRRLRLLDVVVWFFVSALIFFSMIWLPFRSKPAFESVSGLVRSGIVLFGMAVVMVEALLLWLLFIRPRSTLKAILVSVLGNIALLAVAVFFLCRPLNLPQPSGFH